MHTQERFLEKLSCQMDQVFIGLWKMVILFRIGLGTCGVHTCQDEVSTSSVRTAVTKRLNTRLRTLSTTLDWSLSWCYTTKYKRMAETLQLPQTDWDQRSSFLREFQGTCSTSKFFEATLTGSFQESAFLLWRLACSKTDKSNCYSHETLFREATCGFKRRSAVNYALNSGVGKNTTLRLQAVWLRLASFERIVLYRHGALLIVRECNGFNPRRWRHWRWCAGQRTGRQWKRKSKSER